MAYERCVRKKLRSLFEYLDADKDGRITPSCLQSGLIRLQNYSMESSTKNGTGTCSSEYPQICEYEIEELLRAVPRFEHLLCFAVLRFLLLCFSYAQHTHISIVCTICIHLSYFFPLFIEICLSAFLHYDHVLCYSILSHPTISY